MFIYIMSYDLPFNETKHEIKVEAFNNVEDAWNKLKSSMINEGGIPPSFFDYDSPDDYFKIGNNDNYDKDDFYLENAAGVIKGFSTIGKVNEDPHVYTTIFWCIIKLNGNIIYPDYRNITDGYYGTKSKLLK